MKEIKKLIHSYTKWGGHTLRQIISLFLYGEREITENEASTALEQWKKEIPALEDLTSIPERVLSSLSSLSEEEKWVFLFIWKTQNARSVWVSSGIWGSEWVFSSGRNKGYTYEEAWYTFKKEREEILRRCIEKARYLLPLIKKLISFLEKEIELNELNAVIRQRREDRIRREKEERERRQREHEETMQKIEKEAKEEREKFLLEAKEKGMPPELLQVFKMYLEKSVDTWEINRILDNYGGQNLIENFLLAKEEILENKEKFLIKFKEVKKWKKYQEN